MLAGEWDETAFFRAIHGVRALMIGRRALIVLGIPVLTADYDLWLHVDDIQKLNDAVAPLELFPNRTAAEARGRARGRGRYVLEGDEHVDVLIARSQTTKDDVTLHFDEVWARREVVQFQGSVEIAVPCIDDLIGTKKWAMRPKDLPDIQLLEALRRERGDA
jgi:hypothetical protein